MTLLPNRSKVLTILLTSCFASGVADAVKPIDAKAQEWGYGGAVNPTRWEELSSKYSTCETGNAQSPINIQQVAETNLPRINFDYQPTPLEVVNNGHTIKVNYEPGSSIQLNGQQYELKQFHFHTPSEHRIEGTASAMEMHFVHKNQAGDIAVVAALMKEGNSNPALEKIWEDLPAEGEKKKSDTSIDASRFLPQDRAYYNYTGSLTSPPCSEGVNWLVLETPIEASQEQVEKFMELYSVNARPVQPLNGRQIQLKE
ncbi:MAG: carbonate dehydratase [Cyanobacteria bacterium QS_3_48_167]|nr:MAG: carbonate dehydratase [Cyanobacteria bacterium QS_3_48_167]